MTWPFEKEEFLLIYQDQLDVTRDLKDKAWKATHYSVLGQVAVYALYGSIKMPSCADNFTVTILSVLVSIWAFLLVNHLQRAVCGRRKVMKFLRAVDPDSGETEAKAFENIWAEIQNFKRSRECLCERWEKDRPISLAYLAAIVVPTIVVLNSIWQWWS